MSRVARELVGTWKSHYKVRYDKRYYNDPRELKQVLEFVNLNIGVLLDEIELTGVKMALFLESDKVGDGVMASGRHRIAPTLSNFFKYLSRLPDGVDEEMLDQLRSVGYKV